MAYLDVIHDYSERNLFDETSFIEFVIPKAYSEYLQESDSNYSSDSDAELPLINTPLHLKNPDIILAEYKSFIINFDSY